MNKADFENAWRKLKTEIDENPVSQVLGLDLIRAKLLNSSHVLEHLHLQVFGKDAFLRNMLQRILVQNIRRNVPIILLASGKEEGLLEETAEIFNGIEHSREHILLLHSRLRPRLSVHSFQACDLFERKMFQKLRYHHLYAEFGDPYRRDDDVLLRELGNEIKQRFAEEEVSPWAFSSKPFVYIFLPEALPKDYLISDRAKDLKDYACVRIFSEQVQMFNRQEAGAVYGPEIYSVESCEEMREH